MKAKGKKLKLKMAPLNDGGVGFVKVGRAAVRLAGLLHASGSKRGFGKK